uniref:Tail protein n=1 Tax=viral metagenome TaxID=1070528 RepID=A0A6H1Z8A6_9ZZZZ
MEPESALRAWALADGTVAGLIGTRFYPMELPQQPTLPACTYNRVSYVRPDEIPYPTVRVQVTCWAATHSGAWALARAIEAAASRKKGTAGGMTIKYASVVNNLDLRDPTTGYYTVPVDFKVTYREV